MNITVVVCVGAASHAGTDIHMLSSIFQPTPAAGGGKYNAEVHKDHIFGKHIANYMSAMKDDDPEEYQRHFSHYIKVREYAHKLLQHTHTHTHTHTNAGSKMLSEGSRALKRGELVNF